MIQAAARRVVLSHRRRRRRLPTQLKTTPTPSLSPLLCSRSTRCNSRFPQYRAYAQLRPRRRVVGVCARGRVGRHRLNRENRCSTVCWPIFRPISSAKEGEGSRACGDLRFQIRHKSSSHPCFYSCLASRPTHTTIRSPPNQHTLAPRGACLLGLSQPTHRCMCSRFIPTRATSGDCLRPSAAARQKRRRLLFCLRCVLSCVACLPGSPMSSIHTGGGRHKAGRGWPDRTYLPLLGHAIGRGRPTFAHQHGVTRRPSRAHGHLGGQPGAGRGQR